MHNWANFCNIANLNFKQNYLVAFVASRFFCILDNIEKLSGVQTFVVPPEIDSARNFLIKDINVVDKSKGKIEISMKENISEDEMRNLKGKSLLLNMEELVKIFGEIPYEDNDLIGQIATDVNLGVIGKITGFGGTDLQKHIIVNGEHGEIIVPYVDDIVLSVEKDNVCLKLPEGLMEINK